MSRLVLIDNTVLTNFALVSRPDLVLALWPGACTTSAALAEYQAGVTARGLPADIWKALAVVALTASETALANSLSQRLGAGERSCIAVAHERQGLFASDDFDARRQAQAHGIPTTGTIGILLLNIRQKRLPARAGNDLLRQLIELGYRSPVTGLDDLI